jgi:tRNA G26 N,N-dimethylase Trm1
MKDVGEERQGPHVITEAANEALISLVDKRAAKYTMQIPVILAQSLPVHGNVMVVVQGLVRATACLVQIPEVV